jgi:hypothetical protein
VLKSASLTLGCNIRQVPQAQVASDGAWRSSLIQDFMDLLKRPRGLIYVILYNKLEPH